MGSTETGVGSTNINTGPVAANTSPTGANTQSTVSKISSTQANTESSVATTTVNPILTLAEILNSTSPLCIRSARDGYLNHTRKPMESGVSTKLRLYTSIYHKFTR